MPAKCGGLAGLDSDAFAGVGQGGGEAGEAETETGLDID
jgi:hypothetical protein